MSAMLFAFAAVACLVCDAQAQNQQRRPGGQGGQGQPGRGQGMGGGFGSLGKGMLLANKSVQEEMKMTDEQKTKAKEVSETATKKMTEMREKLRDLSREEQTEKRKTMTKEMDEEVTKAIAGILKPEQIKRLDQIELQTKTWRAFTDEAVVAKLKLSDEQKEDVKKLSEEFAKDSGFGGRGQGGRPGAGGTPGVNRPGAGGGDIQEMLKKMQAKNQENLEKLVKVLNADQQKVWKDMTGEKFEIKIEPRQPRTDL